MQYGRLGKFGFFECVDCGSRYRKASDGHIKCNDANITLCPWCRPDSKPFKYGRGL